MPSAQASQWRTNRWSNTWPEALSALRAAIRWAVQAGVSQSGNTAMATTSVRPSGETRKAATSSGRCVTCTGAVPSSPTRQTWSEPERPEMA